MAQFYAQVKNYPRLCVIGPDEEDNEIPATTGRLLADKLGLQSQRSQVPQTPMKESTQKTQTQIGRTPMGPSGSSTTLSIRKRMQISADSNFDSLFEELTSTAPPKKVTRVEETPVKSNTQQEVAETPVKTTQDRSVEETPRSSRIRGAKSKLPKTSIQPVEVAPDDDVLEFIPESPKEVQVFDSSQQSQLKTPPNMATSSRTESGTNEAVGKSQLIDSKQVKPKKPVDIESGENMHISSPPLSPHNTEKLMMIEEKEGLVVRRTAATRSNPAPTTVRNFKRFRKGGSGNEAFRRPISIADMELADG
ncbi:hypothetical protein HDV05_007790 [Chytridiales sp. JEL 0842]|nr:hypothetical protein HDV05_007790 [Chytridiales sp. JEL 0842]